MARLTPKAAPSASQSQRAKVAELVDDAIERGAQATTGARAWGGEGCFYQPTVLSGVSDDARILREEVCGPVAPITTFADEDEALAEALATEYGLVAYLFTRDLDRAVRVGEPLRTGMVGINPFGVVKASGFDRESSIPTPATRPDSFDGVKASRFGRESSIPTPATRPDSFGGVKASGFGREGGNEGIEEYLEAKYLALTVRS